MSTSTISVSNIIFTTSTHSSSSTPPKFFHFPSPFAKSHPFSHFPRKALRIVSSKASEPEAEEVSSTEDEWLKRLPDKKKPFYSHSLPCIEAWLRDLGFNQTREDRAVWSIAKPEWHAQLSLDVTDLYIR